jgi:hypothetical protein
VKSIPAASIPHSGQARSNTQIQFLSSGTIGMP